MGWSPLYEEPRLAEQLGLGRLWVKDDGQNPTASLKDRASAMAVAKAREAGAQVIACSSTGNAASSLAGNAAAAGLDGVVCSPLEAGAIHRRCGASFLTVTPGVRFAGGDAGDQKRVTTPAKARELGSDYIVVGRPITQAEDPVAAYRRCVKEFAG